jgi:phosphate transport system substrate-binding protein
MLRRFSGVAVAAVLLSWPATAFAEPLVLKESGSTLMAPLFQIWAADYAKAHPEVTLTTAATGSGEGVTEALSGAAQIGASDAYLSDDQAKDHPGFVDIALAISAISIVYNLPDLKAPLKLDGPTLAAIYEGRIRSWDDKAIAAMNPGVALPNHEIITVRRAEASGDTFVFSQYLSFATTTREDDVSTVIAMPSKSWGDAIGFGTTIDWPSVPSALSAKGNDGMVDALGKTPYSIGYVGISFTDKINEAKLSTAAMRSFSGAFVQPTSETITAAAQSLTPRTPPDERLTLVNAPGDDCYPLINYEYAVVATKQDSEATAAALRSFLTWAVAPDEDNAKRLASTHFIALPPAVWAKTEAQIQGIK